MMDKPFRDLFDEYARELRQDKEAAEAWWDDLKRAEANTNGGGKGLTLLKRWPFGPASHPWVINTYRKYYFLCKELNRELEGKRNVTGGNGEADIAKWGSQDTEQVTGVEPKVFVLDLLAGGETNDLYEFLMSLVYVPIGLKNDDTV